LENAPGQVCYQISFYLIKNFKPSGSTLLHLRKLAVNSEALKSSNTITTTRKLTAKNLPNALSELQIFGSCRSSNLRLIEESRLRLVKQTPSFSSEVFKII
jgi:hypothetical protein